MGGGLNGIGNRKFGRGKGRSTSKFIDKGGEEEEEEGQVRKEEEAKVLKPCVYKLR